MIFECDIVHVCRRSRLGAWIEILRQARMEHGISRRSRLGAWIEIPIHARHCPALESLPFGSVD